MNGGLPLMGVPLGADHPPGGCPQQPRQVVRNDRPVTATLRKGATTCMARHVACAGEDSRVTVGSTPTVYHRRPEARGKWRGSIGNWLAVSGTGRAHCERCGGERPALDRRSSFLAIV